MGGFSETWRGGSAIARWLGGAPLMSLRVTLMARNRQAARAILTRHSAKMLGSCRIEVVVDGPIPAPGKGCVLCYNETSLADVVAFSAVMWPYIDRAAAADIYAWIPFARAACRKAGIALVPRGNREATGRLLEKTVAAVKRGERVAWGGEGRLSGQDAVTRFKVGASLIAIRSGAPLVPVAFHGGHQALPLGSIRARPGKISVRFGAPIPTTGLRDSDARDVADHAQAAVAGIYADLGAQGLVGL